MRIILTLAFTLSITGCSTINGIVGLVPSFWDPNQAARITDVRMAVQRIDCAVPHKAQIQTAIDHVIWFQLYSESSGRRHQDVIKITDPLKITLEEWVKKADTPDSNAIYCRHKRGVAQLQAKRAAEAILGRF